jgi:hypothetical protein
MNKELIPYKEALSLKELGFDENCFRWYDERWGDDLQLDRYNTNKDLFMTDLDCSTPTYSQAFRFFREKYGLHTWVGCKTLYNGKTVYIGNGRTIPNTLKDGFIVDIIPYEPKDTPEEAELGCLRKLIEIVKNK